MHIRHEFLKFFFGDDFAVEQMDFALRVLQFAVQRVASYDDARPWRGGELERKIERSFADGMGNPRRVRG